MARSKDAFEQTVSTYVNKLQFLPCAGELVARALLSRLAQRQQEYDLVEQQTRHAIARLETEKAQSVQAFKAATTDTMRCALEADMERLDLEISNSAAQRRDTELSECDLNDYIAALAEVLEHPAILLETPEDTRVQRARYLRIFEELPTLSEMEAGTAKLTPIIRAVEGVRDHKSVLVRLRGLTWNHIRSEILRNKNEGEGRGEKPSYGCCAR